MKKIIKFEDLPLPIDRNRLALVERTSRFGGNGVKQDYQAQVREILIPQIPDDWEVLTCPVFLVFEFRFGELIIKRRGKPDKKFNGSNCDVNNVIDRKMLIDAMTWDRRKSIAGKFDANDPSLFYPNRKFKPGKFPSHLVGDNGETVRVIHTQIQSPAYTKAGTLRKREYKLAVTVEPPQAGAKRLWYPDPDQSHAIFKDDSRRYIPLPSLPLQLEINSDNPGVDVTIYDMSEYYDFDHNRTNLGCIADQLHDALRNIEPC